MARKRNVGRVKLRIEAATQVMRVNGVRPKRNRKRKKERQTKKNKWNEFRLLKSPYDNDKN